MTQNLFSVICAATIITSALKAIYMQRWISVTDNKVSAGVKSCLGEEKHQADFRRVSGLLQSHCQKYHLPVPSRLPGAITSCWCHKTTLDCLLCCPAGGLTRGFLFRHCSSVLGHHLVMNLGETTAPGSAVKGNARDCQIWTA